jgi:hypothetical protein
MKRPLGSIAESTHAAERSVGPLEFVQLDRGREAPQCLQVDPHAPFGPAPRMTEARHAANTHRRPVVCLVRQHQVSRLQLL